MYVELHGCLVAFGVKVILKNGVNFGYKTIGQLLTDIPPAFTVTI